MPDNPCLGVLLFQKTPKQKNETFFSPNAAYKKYVFLHVSCRYKRISRQQWRFVFVHSAKPPIILNNSKSK